MPLYHINKKISMDKAVFMKYTDFVQVIKKHQNYGEEIAAKALIYAVLQREIPIIQ